LTLPRYRQQVEPGLTPVTQAQPAADAGVGLATAGRALVQAGQLTGSIGLQEYERGINSDNARAMAGFGQEAGDTFARFKALRGEQAVQGAELARLALENARKRWGESLSTDAAKGLFERQSTELAGRYGLGVTSHSLDQLREAEEASAGAAHVSAVNQAALHYNDPTMLDTLATQAGAQAYQLRASDEDGRAKVYAIRQDVLASAISGALKATEQDPKALDHAKALFYGNREALGAKGPGIEAEINNSSLLRAGNEEAIKIADKMKTGENGWLDTTDMQTYLDAIPDPNVKKATEANLKDRIAIDDARRKAQTSSVWNPVLSAYVQGGLSAAERVRTQDGKSAMGWLNRNRPDLEKRLRDDAYAKWRQSKSDKSEVQRELREARKLAHDDFLSRPVEEQATLDLAATYGGTTDELGLGDIGVLQRKAKNAVDKGQALKVGDFLRDGLAQGFGVVGVTGSKATRKRDWDNYRSALTEAYYGLGDDPKEQDKQQAIDGLLSPKTTERSLNPLSDKPFGLDSTSYGYQEATKTRAASTPPAPTADARKPVKYRVSPDGKQRAPVYADGTIGAVETVP
jgi:hypothetical protein